LYNDSIFLIIKTWKFEVGYVIFYLGNIQHWCNLKYYCIVSLSKNITCNDTNFSPSLIKTHNVDVGNVEAKNSTIEI